jgi:hypothetical protein
MEKLMVCLLYLMFLMTLDEFEDFYHIHLLIFSFITYMYCSFFLGIPKSYYHILSDFMELLLQDFVN